MTHPPTVQAEAGTAPAGQPEPTTPPATEPAEREGPPFPRPAVPRRGALPGWPLIVAAELAVSGACALIATGLAWLLAASPAGVYVATRAHHRHKEKKAEHGAQGATAAATRRRGNAAAARRAARRALSGLSAPPKPHRRRAGTGGRKGHAPHPGAGRKAGKGKRGASSTSTPQPGTGRNGRVPRRKSSRPGVPHRSTGLPHGSRGSTPRSRRAGGTAARAVRRAGGRALVWSWSWLWPALAALLATLLFLLRLARMLGRLASKAWRRRGSATAPAGEPPFPYALRDEDPGGGAGGETPPPRAAGRPVAIAPRQRPTPGPPAPTTTGSTPMPIAEKCGEIKDVSNVFDPESMLLEARARMVDWARGLGLLAESLADLGEKAGTWPMDVTIKEHVPGVAPLLRLAEEKMMEAVSQFDIIHATEIANVGRAKQEMWNPERNQL